MIPVQFFRPLLFIFSGYYCVPNLVVPGDVSSVMSECPDGFFCPNGTGYNWEGCPAGTFGNAPRLTQASECTPCTAGYYCQGRLTSSSTTGEVTVVCS